jgi:hypothetical protein|tara:strand:+ start:340 stop:942 length:603 start_codon:yes stop_codon:yes gene_type:complete
MLKKPNTLNKTSTANKAVDGLGRSMRDYTFDRVENRFVHNDDLVHVSSYDMKPKVGSPEHRKKNPQLYGYHYTSKIDQAIYPPGEAPSENGQVKYDKRGYPNKATPEQMGATAERLERMHQMEGKPDKTKNKKINTYAEVKIPIPTIINHSLLRKSVADKNKAAALEKLRVFAFTPRPNDVVKGIGSLMKTIAVKPEEEI